MSQVFSCLFGDTERCIDKFTSVSGAKFGRIRGCCQTLVLRQRGPSRRLHKFFTDDRAVYYQRQANKKRYHPRYPKSTKNLGNVRRDFAAGDKASHKDKQENRQGKSHATDNYARFDFVVTPNLGCNPSLKFKLCLASLFFLCREKHLLHPGLAPIKFFLWFPRSNDLHNGMQVHATHFT